MKDEIVDAMLAKKKMEKAAYRLELEFQKLFEIRAGLEEFLRLHAPDPDDVGDFNCRVEQAFYENDLDKWYIGDLVHFNVD